MIKKIGVLTGGGDCPGLNAVLRAVVKTAVTTFGYEVIGYKDGYRGLVLNEFVQLKPDDVSGILDKGGTILGTSNRDNPFKFTVEKDGKTTYADMSDRIINNMSIFGVQGLLVIGGDGSLSYAVDLAKKGVKIVMIPKTIDNDIGITDMSVGFMTAVETATEAIDKLHTTAESHHRVMILEVMGRYAGWIALNSGVAGGADIILIPEIPYDIMKVAHKILERRNAGKSFSIIVVAEAAMTSDGKYVGEEHTVDGVTFFKLSGIGDKIAHEIEDITKIETRVTVLGHLQRGGRPTPFDRILATRLGGEAVELASKGDFGKMVCLKGNEIISVDIEDANNNKKTVDPQGEMVRIARNVGVTFGD